LPFRCYLFGLSAHENAIEQLNRLSFGAARFTRAAYLIREKSGHECELSFIALNGDKIVGSVRQTKIVIGQLPALLLGPLVVDDHYKNIGIGAGLMRRAIAAAQSHGHQLILLVGDESYYVRFGFTAHKPPIILPAPADRQRVLIYEITPGVAQQATGRVRPINSVSFEKDRVYSERT